VAHSKYVIGYNITICSSMCRLWWGLTHGITYTCYGTVIISGVVEELLMLLSLVSVPYVIDKLS